MIATGARGWLAKKLQRGEVGLVVVDVCKAGDEIK